MSVSLTFGEGLTIGSGINIGGGSGGGGGGGSTYTTWSGMASADNPRGWTTQLYGSNTVSLPWQWGGYNMTQALPTVGQTVSDTNGHSGVIQSITHNRGASGDNLLIYLTSNVPGLSTVTSVTII